MEGGIPPISTSQPSTFNCSNAEAGEGVGQVIDELDDFGMAGLELFHGAAQEVHVLFDGRVFTAGGGGRRFHGFAGWQKGGFGSEPGEQAEQLGAGFRGKVGGGAEARFDLANGFLDHNQVPNCPSLFRNSTLNVVIEP
jgi:hypothetical protein